MHGVDVALAAEMRGSRPTEKLSGFETCLLARTALTAAGCREATRGS
jgi:hypothetical protein